MRQVLRAALALIAVIAVIAIPVGAGWYVLHGRAEPSASKPAGTGGGGDGGNFLTDLVSQLMPADPNERVSQDPTEVDFEVKQGETARSVSQRLKDTGLIANSDAFRALLRSQNVDTKLEAGTYRLRKNMTAGEIVAALQHGMAPGTRVTIPEGRRIEEAAAILEQQGVVKADEFLRLAKTSMTGNYAVLGDKPAGASLEGYLFPDTYDIDKKWSAPQVLDLMVKTMDEHFTPDMRQQAAQDKLSVFQVLTLASIVEREAVLEKERPVIASVYLNRMAEGMNLEADPTVQYALGFDSQAGTWWRPLLLDDLSANSPYNTYQNGGLPPGPICNPGLSSIQAVLQPAKTDYLFFVANAVAKDGSHVFARTFAEHQNNVEQYGAH